MAFPIARNVRTRCRKLLGKLAEPNIADSGDAPAVTVTYFKLLGTIKLHPVSCTIFTLTVSRTRRAHNHEGETTRYHATRHFTSTLAPYGFSWSLFGPYALQTVSTKLLSTPRSRTCDPLLWVVLILALILALITLISYTTLMPCVCRLDWPRSGINCTSEDSQFSTHYSLAFYPHLSARSSSNTRDTYTSHHIVSIHGVTRNPSESTYTYSITL